MKRIFIVGASILQLPAIKKAKEMGLYVGVADFNPKAVGIFYADEYFNVSTIDEKGIYKAAKEFRADGIMTLATDMPVRSVAYTAYKLNLIGPSYETAVKATDKGEMIKAFEENGVEHPWYFIIEKDKELEKFVNKITFPCIIKPVDNAGSRGVVLINSKKELKSAVNYSLSNSHKGSIIVEEYLKGNEVSVEVMAINGGIHILQVTDKLTTGAPHFVEMGHSQPSQLGMKNISVIKDLAVRATKSVGIDNGPVHVEIMLTEKGPRMIELGARMGGDCISTDLVPLSTGIDMVKATIKIALGEIPDIEPKFDKGSAIRYLKESFGMIKKVSGVKDVKKMEGIQQVTILKNIGDTIGRFGSSTDRIGYIISQAEKVSKAVEYCREAVERIKITVD